MKNKNFLHRAKNHFTIPLKLVFILLFLFSLKMNAQVSLTLNVFIQGFYSGNGLMKVAGAGCLFVTGESANPDDADRIKIAAINPSNLPEVIDEQQGILKTDGSVSVTFGPSVIEGEEYYIRVLHRNSIETWSANPVMMSATTTYLFSSSATAAFADNETILPPDNIYFGIFSGDIWDGGTPGSGIQDGSVDATDFLELITSIYNGDGGYLVGDLNGDGAVDGFDYLVFDPNSQSGVGAATP